MTAEAADWLVQLDGDEPLATADLTALKQWLDRSPAHRRELADLARLWGRMNVLTELAVPLGRAESPPSTGRTSRRNPAVGSFWRNPTLAAAAALVVGVGIWIGLPHSPAISPNGLYATVIGQQRTITLVDGSTVQLNTNSQLEVDYVAASRDIRLLQGEASFEVAKEPGRPFVVRAGSNEVRAVGTAFVVYKRDQDIQVTVTEGRVQLMTDEPAAIRAGRSSAAENAAGAWDGRDSRMLGTLEAGQSVTIAERDDDAGTLANSVEAVQSIGEAQLKQMLSWREGLVIFRGEPLEDVVAEVSRYTLVDIEIADPAIRSIRIGGQFRIGETDAMFEVLETGFGLRVIRLGDHRVLLAAADRS